LGVQRHERAYEKGVGVTRLDFKNPAAKEIGLFQTPRIAVIEGRGKSFRQRSGTVFCI
jgi:hypothetical protein